MVRDLVSAVRKEGGPKPPEMVLREILIIAATVLDETFHAKGLGGGYDHVLSPAARMLVVLAIAAACSLLIGGLLGTRQVAHFFQVLRHG
jgi:hypothetical protein